MAKSWRPTFSRLLQEPAAAPLPQAGEGQGEGLFAATLPSPRLSRERERGRSAIFTRGGCSRLAAVLLVALLCGSARPAAAGEADFRKVTDYLWFALGASIGFVLHEGSHLTLDYALDARPTFVGVKLGPFPFFAIQPTNVHDNQRRYAIAQAGFMMQDLYSELILQIDPKLRQHHRPLLKGMMAMHLGLSLGYAITGFAGIGPPQSDVNTMARALGVPPWGIGLMLMAPVVCDTYRYFVPESRWAPWVSIAGKLSMIGAALTF